ncbi:stability/partitioning determinant [Agrobacterium tumefaciens]|uniref:stability/partitioning determinant n=1 Tax=Agrobacterium tumefaciens TaxID=358 RepID=UPI001572138C|nr:stability/partitioning determinant [Agrobacterium tumefaciens]
MTGDEKKRATLDFGDELETPPLAPPVDPNAVKAATRAAGFRETPRAAEQSTPSGNKSFRRTRRKTGRTEQFATRLRADTIEAIYGYADSHEITLAETIERAIAALEAGPRTDSE